MNELKAEGIIILISVSFWNIPLLVFGQIHQPNPASINLNQPTKVYDEVKNIGAMQQDDNTLGNEKSSNREILEPLGNYKELKLKDNKANSDQDDEVTVETVENTQSSYHNDEQNEDSTRPPPLPIPHKFISSKDLMNMVGRGLEAAKVVANLVSLGLASHNSRPEHLKPPATKRVDQKPKLNLQDHPLLSTISGFFNVIGVDRSKMETLAVNSLVVLVHLVINNLIGKENLNERKSKQAPEGTMYSWIFQNIPPQLKELIEDIQEPGVEERIIGLVRERSPLETDCVQLLICRLAPVIWGMQRALTRPPPSGWSTMTPVDRMYAYLPSFPDLVRHRPRCEIRFPNCRIKYRHLYKHLEERLTQTKS